MQRPRFPAPWRDPSKVSAAQAVLGLGFVVAGVWPLSPPAALLLVGLLLWHDATRPPPPPRPDQPPRAS